MPRIPFGISSAERPASSGIRGGVVQTPVVQEPGIDADAATMPGRALAEFGQQHVQIGQYVDQAQAYQFQRQRAQDTLDAKVGFQDLRPTLRTDLERMKQESPYQTLAEDFRKHADQLIAERGRGMTPQARMLFTEAAKQELATLHHEASQVSSQRRDNATIQSVLTEVNWLQQQYQQSADAFEREYHKESLTSLVTSFVGTGLIKGEVGAKILADTERGLQLGQAHMAIRTAPSQALTDIVTRMQGGEATTPALQAVPTTALPELFDEAQQQLRHQVSLVEAQKQHQRRALQDEQKNQASGYRMQIYQQGATAQTLLSLIDPINQDRRSQKLGEEDHTQLLAHIQTRLDKLQDDAYKDRDMPAVATEGRIRIETAQTPDELASAQQWVYAKKGQLSSDTVGSMLARITARGDQNDPLNDEVAKEAKRVFLSGAFPGGIVPAVLDKIDGGIQAKTSAGMDVLNTELRRIYETEGRDAMRSKAIDVGRRLKDLYFPEGRQQQGPLPAGLPQAFEGITNFEDGIIALDAMTLNPTARRRIYMQLKESLPRRKPQTGVPQEPGLGQVKGYKAPRTPYAPMEQR